MALSGRCVVEASEEDPVVAAARTVGGDETASAVEEATGEPATAVRKMLDGGLSEALASAGQENAVSSEDVESCFAILSGLLRQVS